MLAILFLIALVFFVLAFKFYGGFMARIFGLDKDRKTPADAMYDGVDYCPAHPAVLMGHHFSSIAGAGPIVGPITAASVFGWLPAYLWCVLGSAFLGGPHDTGSLVASIRHEGKSISSVVKTWVGERGGFLFLSFSTLTLILVVAVFLQLSAVNMAADPAVAFAAVVYMALAIIFGLMVYRFNLPLKVSTIIMLPLVFGACWFAKTNPGVAEIFKFSLETWRWILVGYIIVASLLPVWLLLQPRDYLASYFLYFAVIVGAIGMLFGSAKFEVILPAFKTFTGSIGGFGEQYLWPILFVTVACGAISGFHSMVGSGTSSKQLRKEHDSIIVGYGSMLLEGMVAVIAIGTIMVAGEIGAGGPMGAYSRGFGQFGSLIGIDPALGTSLGLLAVNSFLLTSLDTATRLTRYHIQEFSGGKINKYVATVIAVACALVLVLPKTTVPVWAVIWPIFGSANQLVAALALLGIATWLAKGLKVGNRWLMYPMWFMLITTIAALFMLIRDHVMAPKPSYVLIVLAVVLVVLALLMLREALKALKSTDVPLAKPASSAGGSK
ncbi:MAG: carbon starvation protein A [Deltaproteobacteria bacterium]|jgi:carbon starvation protein|nr:carbon starvation protein A [Deltaproteobacteria bacterium]